MTTSPPFLNVPYGGYVHSQVPSEDTELTHVGPGTPPASGSAASGSRCCSRTS